LLATGEEKAGIIAKAVEGPITSMISATALQLHPECTLILDEAAGSRLKESDYYHWVFENQPEWEPFRTSSRSAGKSELQTTHPLVKKSIEIV
jgi:glucosamine-6-phosphate deaminase